ncbi:cysteine synthase [Streptomyces sp. SAI-218]
MQSQTSLQKTTSPSGQSALSQLVGNTPLLRVSEPLAPAGRGFWAKLEGFNPGGIKDRPGLHMVERARTRGDLRPGGRIIESTSGTLGLGLALAGMVYGHPVTLVTDPGLELSMTRLLTAYGAQVNVVSEPHPTGGWQQARRERVQRLLEQHPESWCPDQYNNPDNVAAYTPLALELASEMGHIDVLVCSVGTGGHSAGVSRVLRQLYPDLTVVGVDTTGSTIFGQPRPAPPDARPRLQHLPPQRRLRELLRGALGGPARGGVDLPATRRLALRHRRMERGGGRPGVRLAGPDDARGRPHRGDLPRWPAALPGHGVRRRLLRCPRPAGLTSSSGA